MKNSIEVINLSKSYKIKKAVNNISFKIDENEIVGLLGPNGCGKTTTIGMILGLIAPTHGEILIENRNMNELNRDEVLARFNFASPYVELPKKLTVRQNLEIFARLYGVSDTENSIDQIANDLDLKKIKSKAT